ncbi:MAG: isocitrate/isopropylmalate family dehydrogenase, partial [Pseudomonadota bacterium]
MPNHDVLFLPGDGIGPEVMDEVARVVAWFNARGTVTFNLETDLVGGAAYDAHGAAVSDATVEKALKADSVIFGAVGGAQWDDVPYEHRPEAGLLRLRKDL